MGTRPAPRARPGERDGSAWFSGGVAVCAAIAAAAACGARSASAVISSDIQPDTGYFAIINNVVGADTFYNNGYFGQRTAIANIEAGLVWDGHETTSQKGVTYFYDPSTFQTVAGQPEYDGHATAVGMTMAGLGPPVPPFGGRYYYQLGISPGATLWSAAVATSYGPAFGEFNVSAQTLRYAYQTVCTQTVFRGINGNLYIDAGPDVINSSWGFTDPSGSDAYSRLIDAIVYTYHKTFVVAAGNTQNAPPANQVGGPASGFNGISVGALADDMTAPIYNHVAAFSNRGPNDFYNPVTQTTIAGVRCGVDICAPGTNLIVAAYTGATGSNTGETDPKFVSPPPYPTNLYYIGAAGTSFAAPIVAGGASLVADAGWVNFQGGVSVDGRTIKAVLLNSADKIPGWSNNLAAGNDPLHPTVLTTTQSLDYASGAGALNLTRAYTQYLGGTTDVPGVVITSPVTVMPVGWDFAQCTPANPNDYVIGTPLHAGDMLAATLDWFVEKSFTDNTPVDPALRNVATDIAFFNLDLQVWEVIGGVPVLIAQSDSLYNNVEHVWFGVPDDGQYIVRVLWAGTVYDVPGNTPQMESYGLAWSVTPIPESGSLMLLAMGGAGLMRRRRGSR